MDNQKLKVEIYKDISPLLGHKAVKRIISRSEAQLNPLVNKASQEIQNAVVTNHQNNFNSPFIKLLAQQQAEDKTIVTDRSFYKNFNARSNQSRLSRDTVNVTTNSNKTMLG